MYGKKIGIILKTSCIINSLNQSENFGSQLYAVVVKMYVIWEKYMDYALDTARKAISFLIWYKRMIYIFKNE